LSRFAESLLQFRSLNTLFLDVKYCSKNNCGRVYVTAAMLFAKVYQCCLMDSTKREENLAWLNRWVERTLESMSFEKKMSNRSYWRVLEISHACMVLLAPFL
jgi:competence transcription factor ComK